MTATNRLSPTDWASIVTLWERGEKNLVELAEQFGVSKQSIHKGLKSRGVVKGSRMDEVMGEVNDAARDAREKKVRAANAMVDQFSKYNDALVKVLMKRMIDGAQTPGGIVAYNAEVRTIKDALASLAIARKEQWDINKIEEMLGEFAELPDLNVGEYTPEEIEKIREANEESYLEGIEDEDEEDED